MTSQVFIFLITLITVISCEPNVESREKIGKLSRQSDVLRPTEENAEVRRLSAALNWNEKDIGWTRYDAGLEKAKLSGKPVLVLVYADWCAHCEKYGENFFESDIAAISQKYVMILVNQDREPATSKILSPDGSYTPRTLILSSDGEIRKDIIAGASRFRFFYDYRNPGNLLSAMRKGLSAPET